MSKLSQPSNMSSYFPQAQSKDVPEYTFGGVLQFLQAEWRNFERERNEWEIETSILKAKIATLEGEQRAFDKIKTDLLRRVKMLEFALRQERGKYLSNQLADSEKRISSPISLSGLSPNDLKNATTKRDYNSGVTSGSNGQKIKARKEKCREVVKKCLEELDSFPTIFPKPLETLPQNSNSSKKPFYVTQPYSDSKNNSRLDPSQSASLHNNLNDFDNNLESSQNTSVPPPPAILKRPTPTTALTTSAAEKTSPETSQNFVASPGKTTPQISNNTISSQNNPKKRNTIILPEGFSAEEFDRSISADLDLPKSSEINYLSKQSAKIASILDDPTASLSSAAAGKLSSIFKALGKKTQDLNSASGEYGFSNSDATLLASRNSRDVLNRNNFFQEPDFAFEDTNSFDNYNAQSAADPSDSQIWKPKTTLKSHLDTVRTIDFHSKDMMLASGSDDGSVRLWNLSVLSSKKSQNREYDPSFVYRGHTGPVTCVVIGSEEKYIYSSSFDGTIKSWAFPEEDRKLADPVEPYLLGSTFTGHNDIVWNIKLQLQPFNRGSKNGKKLLASVSADGFIKLWDSDPLSKKPLISTLSFSSLSTALSGTKRQQSVPTAVDFYPIDSNKLVVSYRNSLIHLIDIETGKAIHEFKSDETYDGTSNTQINCLISHPTSPLLISGHEDKYIRVFDINSGNCSHSMVAHLDSISSLDVSSNGLSLVSGGHDASIRWWELSKYSCVQEFSSHRSKSNEAVYGVKYHPNHPWMATCGADSIIKMYGF